MTEAGTAALIDGAARFGVAIDARMAAQFAKYAELLAEWNEKFNLTAITDENDVIAKHFLDSLSVAPVIREHSGAKIIDVGSGAGFPGIPLKLVFPGADCLLMDSTQKKVGFMEHVINELSLSGIKAVHKRAEESGRDLAYRDGFDICAARAVSRLDSLCEYCLPFVKPGGLFIAMKGPEITGELDGAKAAVKALCGEITGVKTITIPFGGLTRTIIVIKKVRHTPSKYPRVSPVIAKNPIK